MCCNDRLLFRLLSSCDDRKQRMRTHVILAIFSVALVETTGGGGGDGGGGGGREGNGGGDGGRGGGCALTRVRLLASASGVGGDNNGDMNRSSDASLTVMRCVGSCPNLDPPSASSCRPSSTAVRRLVVPTDVVAGGDEEDSVRSQSNRFGGKVLVFKVGRQKLFFYKYMGSFRT